MFNGALSNAQVQNSILWNNSDGDVYNIDGVSATITNTVVQGGYAGGTNIITVDPLLGTLGNYGGSTQTIPLLPGSSAINATSANCPQTDQRGITRSTPTCDIGAFESQGFRLTKSGGDNQSTMVATAFFNPLALNVTSAYSEPVNGGKVTFAGPLTGASTNPITNTATITNGAASKNVTANGTAGGPYNVTASANGATSVNFALTNDAKARTTTTFGSSLNPSTFEQMVTFTTTISSLYGTPPTGSITITVNNSFWFSRTIVGFSHNFTYNALPVGTHSLTASYSGDAMYAPSVSSIYMQAVNDKTPTLTALNPASAKTGGLGFTLTVTGTDFVNGATLRWNNTDRTTAFISTTQLTATIPASDLAASGTATVTVRNPTSGVSNALTFNINPATSALTLTSSPNPSLLGNTVMFTATLAQFNTLSAVARLPRDVTPTGTVTFTLDAATNITRTMNAAGVVTYTTNPLTAGAHSVVATYSGDANLVGSTSNTISQQVNYPAPTLASISPTSASVNAPSFTLTVTGTNFINGSIVRWKGSDRATTFVSSTKLTATILKSDLDATGNVTVTVFTPTPGGGTSSSQTFTINPTASTVSVSLTSSCNPCFLHQTIRITGTVTNTVGVASMPSRIARPRDAVPTGTITFQSDGTNIPGCVNVTLNGAGQAVCVTTSLTGGSHTINAAYSGDTNFNATSGNLIQRISYLLLLPGVRKSPP